jgi:hypothetical protein
MHSLRSPLFLVHPRCSFALRRERTHQGDGLTIEEPENRMNTQNVNVKTAAPESSRKMGDENPPVILSLSQALPPLRGLDIRMAWGMARVMRVIDNAKAQSEMAAVLEDAWTAGYHDYLSGEHAVPGMFSDSPQLVNQWCSGWRFAVSAAEVAVCSCCQSDTGIPCPYHD